MTITKLSSEQYYVGGIQSAFDNFENRETTVSHTFREKHPFLLGRSYGEAFYEALKKHETTFPCEKILEVGGGTGDFARNFIGRAGTPLQSYKIAELSPQLAKAQKQTLEESRNRVKIDWVEGSALKLPFQPESFQGTVIANEMIADLDAWKITEGVGMEDESLREGFQNYLARYRLQTFADYKPLILPVGVIKLFEELHRVLTTGSNAVVTEYFDMKGGGSIWEFHQHFEYSFSLDLICHLARQIGFSLELVSLADFLEFEISEPVLTKRAAMHLRDELGYPISITTPLMKSQLKAYFPDASSQLADGFFSRSEMLKLIAHFHVLIMTKRPKLTDEDFVPNLIPVKEKEVRMLRASNETHQLTISHPMSSHEVNEIGLDMWNKIDGKKTLGEIAKSISAIYDISGETALQDCVSFMETLYRERMIYGLLA